MEFIKELEEKAKKNNRTIILPEALDERILKAAEYISKKNIANIILLGNKEKILKKARELSLIFNERIYILDYLAKENEEKFLKIVDIFYELRKEKGITKKEAKEILKDEIYYACMLLKLKIADGVVGGAVHKTKDIIKPALQIIKTKKESKLVSAYFLIDTNNKNFGENGIFFMADCGLNIDPSDEELAEIAIESSKTFKKIFNKEANIACLSFSSFKSAKSSSTEKVINAVNLVKKKSDKINISGEMQLDTAIIKEVAEKKAPGDKVAGKANLLIFPNLDAGNIGYKMASYMSGGKAYGPLLQGINMPINDLSRGSSVEEIIGVILITLIS